MKLIDIIETFALEEIDNAILYACGKNTWFDSPFPAVHKIQLKVKRGYCKFMYLKNIPIRDNIYVYGNAQPHPFFLADVISEDNHRDIVFKHCTDEMGVLSASVEAAAWKLKTNDDINFDINGWYLTEDEGTAHCLATMLNEYQLMKNVFEVYSKKYPDIMVSATMRN